MLALSESVFRQGPRQIVKVTNEYANYCGSYGLWQNSHLTPPMVCDNVYLYR